MAESNGQAEVVQLLLKAEAENELKKRSLNGDGKSDDDQLVHDVT